MGLCGCTIMSEGELKKRINKLDLSTVPIQDIMVLQKESLFALIDEAKKEFPPFPETSGGSMKYMYNKESWNKIMEQFAEEANEWKKKWFGECE